WRRNTSSTRCSRRRATSRCLPRCVLRDVGAVTTESDQPPRGSRRHTGETRIMSASERSERSGESDRFFDLSPDLLAVLTREGVFVKANSSWRRSLGFDPEDLVGTSAIDLI